MLVKVDPLLTDMRHCVWKQISDCNWINVCLSLITRKSWSLWSYPDTEHIGVWKLMAAYNKQYLQKHYSRNILAFYLIFGNIDSQRLQYLVLHNGAIWCHAFLSPEFQVMTCSLTAQMYQMVGSQILCKQLVSSKNQLLTHWGWVMHIYASVI